MSMDPFENSLTEEEAALYDRQIRLWGLDAQRRLRAAKVLLVGIEGLGAEVAKNIVLAGVQSLTLLDHTNVTEEDKCSNFLVSANDVGHNRANKALSSTHELNPMVHVVADDTNIVDKNEEFFVQFDIVCILGSTLDVAVRINDICRRNNIKFYAGDVYGFYGYMFADLGIHEYAVEKTRTVHNASVKINNSTSKDQVTMVFKRKSEFIPLSQVLEFDWSAEAVKSKLKKTDKTYFITRVLLEFQRKHSRKPKPDTASNDTLELLKIKDEVMEKMGLSSDLIQTTFTKQCFAQLSPVCAIVGGVLAQEIIKAVSQKDIPHNNFFFYNGDTDVGMVEHLGE